MSLDDFAALVAVIVSLVNLTLAWWITGKYPPRDRDTP